MNQDLLTPEERERQAALSAEHGQIVLRKFQALSGQGDFTPADQARLDVVREALDELDAPLIARMEAAFKARFPSASD